MGAVKNSMVAVLTLSPCQSKTGAVTLVPFVAAIASSYRFKQQAETLNYKVGGNLPSIIRACQNGGKRVRAVLVQYVDINGAKLRQSIEGALEDAAVNYNACKEEVTGARDAGYRGCQNRTRSGGTSQNWSSQSPRKHDGDSSNSPG